MMKQQALLKEGKNFSPIVCSVVFSVVIGGISDPTVPVPFLSENFGRNLNFDI